MKTPYYVYGVQWLFVEAWVNDEDDVAIEDLIAWKSYPVSSLSPGCPQFIPRLPDFVGSVPASRPTWSSRSNLASYAMASYAKASSRPSGAHWCTTRL